MADMPKKCGLIIFVSIFVLLQRATTQALRSEDRPNTFAGCGQRQSLIQTAQHKASTCLFMDRYTHLSRREALEGVEVGQHKPGRGAVQKPHLRRVPRSVEITVCRGSKREAHSDSAQ